MFKKDKSEYLRVREIEILILHDDKSPDFVIDEPDESHKEFIKQFNGIKQRLLVLVRYLRNIDRDYYFQKLEGLYCEGFLINNDIETRNSHIIQLIRLRFGLFVNIFSDIDINI